MSAGTSSPPLAVAVASRWDPAAAPHAPLAQLVYRSNLLGADRAIANVGGGNTSVKTRERDHVGVERDVLWVKGSGSDLATIDAAGFSGLRLGEVLPLIEREQMSDEQMVAHLARCQLAPDMPRCSIETLLHAFVPAPCVDHTHPDAINMLCCALDGESLARACFGEEAVWIPYLRPGFALAKQVGLAAGRPGVRFVLLAKHGLVTWGETGEESYAATIEAIGRAAAFVAERAAGMPRFGGLARPALDEAAREALLAELLPALRGAVSSERPKVLQVDAAEPVLELVCSREAPRLTQVGAACPDHLVHTKRVPLWIDYDPARDDAAALAARVAQAAERYREDYRSYIAASAADGEVAGDPDPRVVLIAGVGMVGVGTSRSGARLSLDLYRRAIEVMRGAHALGGFASLSAAESYAVEYWPLERYKLSLAPPPRELAGQVALVTGAAGGIGRATLDALAAEGACVVALDIDGEGATDAVTRHGAEGLALPADVTDEAAVAAAFRATALAFGGVDVVVSNAGVASSAPIEETSVELWDRDHAVLVRGYFLVAREAFRVLRAQGRGGSIVFVVSKNALVAGRDAAAYSSAKAAELHLARCLAEEGGGDGIRVNAVNPDAVLRGSRIWGSAWRDERAAAYGIAPKQLEAHYRARTTLGVSIVPADVAQAILHFASPIRSGKSTGNVLNVDGGVPAAYVR